MTIAIVRVLSIFSTKINASGSSHLTPVTAQDILHIRLPTTDTSTLTDQSLQSARQFFTELFKHNNDAIHFYTGFESFNELMMCYRFLGDAVHHLQYRGSTAKSNDHSEARGAPRSLTPLEFFLVLCRLRCSMENDQAYRFGVSQSTVCRILITWINFFAF